MRRSIALVGGLALVLGTSTLQATLPLPGGRVTIVIDGSEEGDAIEAELVRRMTTPFLVHPDGTRSTLRAPDGGPTERAWTIELPIALISPYPELAFQLAESLRSAAGRGMWIDLDTCDPDTSTRPHRVVLRFADPVCPILTRFGAWPAPPSLEPGFRSTPLRAGSFMRNPTADLWQPRLDEITLARSPDLDPPGSSEIIIGSMGSPPVAGSNDSAPVSVAYRLTPASGSWPDSLRTWMAEALPRSAFEPLVPPTVRAEPDLGAEVDSVSVGMGPSGIEAVHLVGPPGSTSDRVRGRARALLARRGVSLRDGSPPEDDTPVLRLDRVVRLSRDPVTDFRLYGPDHPGGPERGWIVLEIRVPVRHGPDVVGHIAAPDLLWRRGGNGERP